MPSEDPPGVFEFIFSQRLVILVVVIEGFAEKIREAVSP
jgi:hypothetical protein